MTPLLTAENLAAPHGFANILVALSGLLQIIGLGRLRPLFSRATLSVITRAMSVSIVVVIIISFIAMP